MLNFKKRYHQQEQGFTLIEVLVAILIITIFITTAMQAVVIAAIFKARAQEYAEATAWIQEDLESMKFQANQMESIQSMTASNDIIKFSYHDFANANTVVFVGDGTIAGGLSKNTTYYVRDVVRNIATNTFTFKVASTAGGAAVDLTTDSTGSLIGIASQKCNATSDTTGYADSLRDLINDPNDFSSNRTSVSFSKVSRFTNKQFTLTRATTIPSNSSDKPYNVLRINYTVTPTSGGDPVAKSYTEVIPNAALQCPSY